MVGYLGFVFLFPWIAPWSLSSVGVLVSIHDENRVATPLVLYVYVVLAGYVSAGPCPLARREENVSCGEGYVSLTAVTVPVWVNSAGALSLALLGISPSQPCRLDPESLISWIWLMGRPLLACPCSLIGPLGLDESPPRGTKWKWGMQQNGSIERVSQPSVRATRVVSRRQGRR
jgi:hypothetical protein